MKECNLRLYDKKNKNKGFNEKFWNSHERVIESFLFGTAQNAQSDSNYYLKEIYSFSKFEKGSKVYFLPYIALYRKEDIPLIEEIICQEKDEISKKMNLEKNGDVQWMQLQIVHHKILGLFNGFYMKIYQYISKVNGETAIMYIIVNINKIWIMITMTMMITITFTIMVTPSPQSQSYSRTIRK